MKKPSLKKIKKHAKRAVIASVASAGIVVGGIFSSPSELMSPDGSTPAALVEMADVQQDDGGTDAAAVTDERRKSVRARLKAWILQLPPWLRAMVGVPLWGLGWLLIASISALWSAVLSPAAAGVLKLLCIAALLAAVLCVALKAVFPELPLKEIINKRSVLTLVGGLALIGVAGAALDVFYPEGQNAAELVRWLGGTSLLLICAVPVIVKASGHRRAKLRAGV